MNKLPVAMGMLAAAWGAAAVEVEVAGPWAVRVAGMEFAVPPTPAVTVAEEAYESLPLYQALGGWNDGLALYELYALYCSLPWALDPASVAVSLADGAVLERGRDYQLNDKWATIGRLDGGRIGAETPVWISYVYTPLRIDAVFADGAGALRYAVGNPATSLPAIPAALPGEKRLVNIYLDARTDALTPHNLLAVEEDAYPEEPVWDQQRLMPGTMAKLRRGEKVTILAWGDSVTECTYLPEQQKWQKQFLGRLRRAFPEAEIELVTRGWSGQTSAGYLAAPEGDPRNFRDTVLSVDADVVISEFVNDALMDPDTVARTYRQILDAFRERGFEWIILTPHYTEPDVMGLPGQGGRELEEDPRFITAFIRRFGAEHGVAVADAARRYGRLYRQGVPYITLMTNCANHPDARGMKIFADALMALFTAQPED